MPALHLFSRDASSSSGLNPIYIAGFIIAGVTVLGVGLWIALRMQKRRAASKSETQRGAAFLSVRGIVRDDEKEYVLGLPPYQPRPPTNQTHCCRMSQSPQQDGKIGMLSRYQLDIPTIASPERAAMQAPPTIRDDVLEYHRQSGSFPRPFAPKPFAFAMAASPRSSMDRVSFMSMSSHNSHNRFSVLSAASSTLAGSMTTGNARKVRQIFSPILPDELLITRVGEQLTVIQSFDDGWCVVGRENSAFAAPVRTLFGKPVTAAGTGAEGGNVELGVVPAWCFVKPVKGLRAERPVRGSSLGITVQMDAPGAESRNELMSWSNF